MKYLKVAGIVLLVSAVALVLGGYALDEEVTIETEAELSATPQVVFDTLTSHEGEMRWWAEAMEPHLDEGAPGLEVRHAGGPPRGEGLEIEFAMGEAVSEEWKLLEAVSPSRVVFEVDFQIFVVTRTLRLRPSGEGTRVHWSDSTSIGNPLMRYLTVIMPEDSVKQNFDGALEALDRVTSKGS